MELRLFWLTGYPIQLNEFCPVALHIDESETLVVDHRHNWRSDCGPAWTDTSQIDVFRNNNLGGVSAQKLRRNKKD